MKHSQFSQIFTPGKKTDAEKAAFCSRHRFKRWVKNSMRHGTTLQGWFPTFPMSMVLAFIKPTVDGSEIRLTTQHVMYETSVNNGIHQLYINWCRISEPSTVFRIKHTSI